MQNAECRIKIAFRIVYLSIETIRKNMILILIIIPVVVGLLIAIAIYDHYRK